MKSPVERAPFYGMMAEFGHPDVLVKAAEKVAAAGFSRVEAYTPFPVHGLHDVIYKKQSKLPLLVLIGGILGGAIGYGMQYFASVIHYPMNIGGKPDHSWPAFIPITFELTILVAAFAAVFGMIFLNGLPKPYHPVFNVERFKYASRDGFFLVIESDDPNYDEAKTKKFLEGLKPKGVYEVEW